MSEKRADQVTVSRDSGWWSYRRGRAGVQQGQALIELTVAIPIIFFLIVLAINYGGWLYAWIEIGNAARAVANYAALGPSSVGSPITPTSTAISSLIATDLASLPNYSSSNPTVVVCWNQNGTFTNIVGTCSSPAGDNEPASCIAISVDLTYTYSPLIPIFSFPKEGIGLPIMPSTIHRRIVMRFI